MSEQEKKMVEDRIIIVEGRDHSVSLAQRLDREIANSNGYKEGRDSMLKEICEYLIPTITTEYGETIHPFEDNYGCPQWSEGWAEELKKKFGDGL